MAELNNLQTNIKLKYSIPILKQYWPQTLYTYAKIFHIDDCQSLFEHVNLDTHSIDSHRIPLFSRCALRKSDEDRRNTSIDFQGIIPDTDRSQLYVYHLRFHVLRFDLISVPKCRFSLPW